MTTIVRYKNLVTSDNIYIDIVGTEVVKQQGNCKIYKHPNFEAVCAISGSISASFFNMLSRHISNIIANLKDYPTTDISIADLQNEFDESPLASGNQSGFECGIFTKEYSVFIHFGKDRNKFTIHVKSPNVLMILGSGSVLASRVQCIGELNPDFTAVDVAKLAVSSDTYTGNKLFVVDLNELGDL